MYALATISLLKQLPTNAEQIWYADDACACGKLGSLFQWWQRLCAVGLSFGYFTNASKTWLVTKALSHTVVCWFWGQCDW